MTKNRTIKIAGIASLLMLVSAITWAIQARYFSKPAKRPVQAWAVPVYDKVLLAKLEKVTRRYDTLKQNYTVAGTINTLDQADSASGRMRNVGFLFCKKGRDLYYRLGQTETINEDGLYLYIDHTSHQIILSAQKAITQTAGVENMSQITKVLRSEFYDLKSSADHGLANISLVNEHHVSCKQYTISYDTADNQIRHISARLTNIRFPMDRSKEKLVDLDISEWDGRTRLDAYPRPVDVLKKEGGKWVKQKGYEGYELINL